MHTPTPDVPAELERVIGTIVSGRYLIEEVIGIGGMAVVFRGRHTRLGREVAIKVLRPEYASHPDLAERFDREARAAANFDHPNCIQVFDCGRTRDGYKFMVMPLLRGNELAVAIGRTMPPAQIAHVALHMLRGLEHAHQHGVVHRDVKPSNAFVTRDHAGIETIKIVDFGIAKLSHEGTDGIKTQVGLVVGTPAYLSPEQALARDIDGRADLYSLGMTLYHLLCGELPFETDDSEAILYQQVHGPPIEVPASPPIFVAAMRKLLAKSRDRRFASASHAIAQFEAVAAALSDERLPWLPLLEPDRRAAETGLRDVDLAFRRVLNEPTPVIHDWLRPMRPATPMP